MGGLARYLAAAGIAVMEVGRPDRAARRRFGKTDTVDAVAAAHAVIAGRADAAPKSGDGPVAALRLFKLAKDSAVKARTAAVNQLKAVLVTADPALREELAGLGRSALIRTCAGLPDDCAAGQLAAATVTTLRGLACPIQALTGEITGLKRHMAA